MAVQQAWEIAHGGCVAPLTELGTTVWTNQAVVQPTPGNTVREAARGADCTQVVNHRIAARCLGIARRGEAAYRPATRPEPRQTLDAAVSQLDARLGRAVAKHQQTPLPRKH